MKKVHKASTDDDMRPEYDFAHMTGGVRGKYARRFQEGTNLVLLAPDVASAFASDEEVNEALRMLLKLARKPHVRRRAGARSVPLTH